ncbi:MAG: Hsp70 family protein, partial [Thermogutta sp.]|nr:Hsp70 family protein [Thermogutta sp.]
MAAPTIAVDFGTTRTKVAVFDEKERQPRLIELGRANLQVIPSVFYVPRDQQAPRLVGDDAQEMVDEDPGGIVENLKKEIHRSEKLRFGPDRPSVDRVELAGELFAYLRRRCREEVFYCEVDACVLTLPVVFEEQKRECIRQAAQCGGFRADRIQVLDEPVAAARAWLWQWEGRLAQSVIVCDVGGGTTDFALLRYSDGDFEPVPELAKGGLPQGGNDLDEGILEEALAGQGRTPLSSPLRMAWLNKCRSLKERIVRDVRHAFSLRLPGEQIVVPREVVQTQTNRFVEQVVEEFRRFMTRCATVADLSGTPVLLVGGASRVVGLKEALEAASPGKVYQWNKSDYAVALGAAIMPPHRRPVAGVEGLGGDGGGSSAAASFQPVGVFGDPGAYLVEAVRQAKAGANVALPAGEYRIPQPLIVERPLTMAGLGRERSLIRWEGEGPAIICRGDCDLTLRDVTVERAGQQVGDLLDALGGRVKIEDSRICGARAASGIRLRGGVRAEIRRCRVDGNSEHGIVLADSAVALIEENICENNREAGISYGGTSGGTARKNTCRENEIGIGIGERAEPEVEENTCENNSQVGIGYLGTSGGTAENNICRENKVGIGIFEDAAPQLEENTCEKNSQVGIGYGGTSGGTARKNTCRENEIGIAIGERAEPEVEENTCEKNSQVGIGYVGTSGGTARKNTCRENGVAGIVIDERAEPELEENTCEKNSQVGIGYLGTSGGTARRNV